MERVLELGEEKLEYSRDWHHPGAHRRNRDIRLRGLSQTCGMLAKLASEGGPVRRAGRGPSWCWKRIDWTLVAKEKSIATVEAE
jgi:hypothetical protein